MQKHKIILDTDIGYDPDDVLALLFAINSPEIEILGITTSFEFTGFKQQITKKILALVGRTDIPVRAGMDFVNLKYFPSSYQTEESKKHGSKHAKRNGKGIFPPTINRYCKPENEFAPIFIKNMAEKYPGKISLICIGPLTNVGYLTRRYPEAASKLKAIYLMGGVVNNKVLPGKREFNIRADVVAAQSVYGYAAIDKVPIFMIGTEVTRDVFVPDKDVIPMVERKKSSLSRIFKTHIKAYNKLYKRDHTILHDPLAIGMLIKPSLYEFRKIKVDIDDAGIMNTTRSNSSRISGVLKVKGNEFIDLFKERISDII